MSIKITARVFVPEEVLNVQEVRSKIERTMRNKTAQEVRREFLKSIQGWDHSPDFAMRFNFGQSMLSATITPSGTDAKIWELVNAGSPAHTIVPRRAKQLRFQTGYRAATRPRVISSRSKSRFGPIVKASAVSHPGFEAREFDKTIAEEYVDTFAEDIQEAIGQAGKGRRRPRPTRG